MIRIPISIFLCAFSMFALVLTSSSLPLPAPNGFTHNAVLDGYENFHLYWKYDEEMITFEVHVRTTGWVGLGFSPNGGMPGSDMIMGWVLDDGDVRFTDRHSTSFSEPVIDDKDDDYNLLMGKEENDVTVLRFERKLDTCDDDHDWLITGDTLRVIWAYHSADPEDDKPIAKHEHRGSKSVQLLSVSTEGAPDLDGPNMYHHDLVINNFAVPVRQTTYACVGQKLPELDGKHHLIAYAPVIQTGHEAIVHHVVIYQCRGPVNESYHQTAHECYTPNMPDDFRTCSSVVMGWAIGGGIFHFPDNTGLSLGVEGDPTFLMVEMHYDNPDRLEGLVDNSGIRMHYTSNLRQYDSGALVTGQLNTMFHAIPPGAEEFSYKSYCSEELTTAGLYDESDDATDVTVFGVTLHMHLLGRQMKVTHMRDGKEINVVEDKHYDFNYQEIRRLHQEIVIKPGDELITECVFDSTSRQAVTYNGFGTDEEMCQAFLYTYPRTKMDICVSFLRINESASAVGIDDLDIGVDPPIVRSPAKWENMTIYEVMDVIEWDTESISSLQQAADSGAYYSMAFGGFTSFWQTGHAHSPLKVTEPLPVPQRDCEEKTSAATVSGNNWFMQIVIALLLAGICFI
ncbi:DBH-like monooxygenase protein 1 homolog [Glandiceps talaboti]